MTVGVDCSISIQSLFLQRKAGIGVSITVISNLPAEAGKSEVELLEKLFRDSIQLAASSLSCPFLEIGASPEVIIVQLSPPSSLQKISPPVVPPKTAH
jgi:hypothetical protein